MSQPPEPGVPPTGIGPELPYAHTLPRLLGPFDAVALVVGSIIGSGIFLKVDTIAREMGSFGGIILVWVAGGLAALCGSLSLSELSAMLPHAGGPYVYLRQAYGRLPAFLWGWIEFTVVKTGSMGSLACATVIYFNRFLVALEQQGSLPAPLTDVVPVSHFGQGCLTVFAVLLLATVNIIGTRWSAWMQNVTSVVKVLFLGFLIVGPLLLGQADVSNMQPIAPASLGPDFWRAFGLALVAVFWPYDGWINIGPVAEEIREPQRNVPLGLTVGLLVVILVYVGANFGYFLTLPMQHVQHTTTVAADVMGKLVGGWGAAIASLGVMISTFGALNSNLLSGPRIYFAMARDGLFPKAIRQVHATFRTPAAAILAQTCWALVLIILVFIWQSPPANPPLPPRTTDAPAEITATEAVASGTSVAAAVPAAAVIDTSAGAKRAFDKLTDFVILGGTLFYALTVSAVFVLRRREPETPRPYRVWAYPLTPLIYLFCVGIVVVSLLLNDPFQVVAVSGLIGAGVGAYYYFVRVEAAAQRSAR